MVKINWYDAEEKLALKIQELMLKSKEGITLQDARRHLIELEKKNPLSNVVKKKRSSYNLPGNIRNVSRSDWLNHHLSYLEDSKDVEAKIAFIQHTFAKDKLANGDYTFHPKFQERFFNGLEKKVFSKTRTSQYQQSFADFIMKRDEIALQDFDILSKTMVDAIKDHYVSNGLTIPNKVVISKSLIGKSETKNISINDLLLNPKKYEVGTEEDKIFTQKIKLDADSLKEFLTQTFSSEAQLREYIRKDSSFLLPSSIENPNEMQRTATVNKWVVQDVDTRENLLAVKARNKVYGLEDKLFNQFTGSKDVLKTHEGVFDYVASMILPTSWDSVKKITDYVKKSNNYLFKLDDAEFITQEGAISLKPSKGYINMPANFDPKIISDIEAKAKEIQSAHASGAIPYLGKKDRSSLNMGVWIKKWNELSENEGYKSELIVMPLHIYDEHYDQGAAAHDLYMRDRKVESAITLTGNNMVQVKKVWNKNMGNIINLLD